MITLHGRICRLIVWTLTAAFVVSLILIGGAERVYATSRTQDDAINWLNSISGQYLDKDGVYGAQCVDLILAYYDYLGVPRSSGNGKDYATNALPSGWSRVQGGTPQKGDILVYGASSNNSYGHVAIYESETVTWHQNWDSCPVRRVTGIRYNGFTNTYWGYIRPNWTLEFAERRCPPAMFVFFRMEIT